jgi:hypothetical protein
VNSQVAGWRTRNRLEQKRRPIDARIVSAHNDGNPHFVGEAVAVTEAAAVTEAVAQEL